MTEQISSSEKWKRQVGALFKPLNFFKTFAGQVPLASIPLSLIDQIEDHETNLRIEKLEANVAAYGALKSAEETVPKAAPPLHDWPIAAGEYIRRIVDVIVVYDSGFHPDTKPGKELYHAVGHGCIFADREVLTCRESVETARDVAAYKGGRVMIAYGMAWYDCEFSDVDECTGLCIGKITSRDEEKWEEYSKMWVEKGLGELPESLPSGALTSSVTPWTAQEIGFVHSGEAENVMQGTAFSKVQFDRGTISHFLRPSDDGLKVFVSSVLGGRILRAGSAVFGRDGQLLGILSGTESYESDNGRRAVIRSLLGHPRFMPRKK